VEFDSDLLPWQFSFSNGTRQPLLVALRAWLTLLGPFGIDFMLAWEGPFKGSSNPVTLDGGACVGLAPMAVMASAWRAGRRSKGCSRCRGSRRRRLRVVGHQCQDRQG
jgi:hypothetical protein